MNKIMKRRLFCIILCAISSGILGTLFFLNLDNSQMMAFYGLICLSSSSTTFCVTLALLKGKKYDY